LNSDRAKRAFDAVVAALALLILSPVFAIVAIALKLDSRGPLFFSQERIGQDGRPFRMIKFRTMVTDGEQLGPNVSATRDPRITRVGALLRRCFVDEAPQLINVLRGDMSLVGPRPLVVDEDQRIEGWHRGRLQLTPGMTGHWQVLGAGRIPLEEMMTIDYLYIANWSLWSDFKILCRTVPYVLGRRGL